MGHFTLPDEAWWEDFYTTMETRIDELCGKYSADREALAVLDQIAQEPAMHRRHSDYYGYEFFVLLRADEWLGPAPAIAGRSNARRIGIADQRTARDLRANVASSVNSVHLANATDTGCYISPLDRGTRAENR